MIKLKLSSNKNLFSYGIRKITSSIYSHVDLVLESGYYIGSQPGIGVVIHKEKCDLEHFYEIDVDYHSVANYMLDQIGKPYDFSGIYGFLIHDRKWQNPDSWFCSELVAAAINRDVPLFSDEVSFVSPGDIIKLSATKRIK